MRVLVTAIAVVAVGAFAFGACGGDGEEEPAAPAPTAEEPTDGGAGGSAETVSVSADPGGALAFEEKTLQPPAGALSFEFENQASVPHDFCLEQEGRDLGCTDEITESSDSLDVELEAGEYAFYFSVPGHREGGMEGTLTVE